MLGVYLGISWLVGIWVASQGKIPVGGWLITAVSATIGALIFRSRRYPRLALFALTAMAFAGARYETAVPHIDTNHVAYYNDTDDVELTGLVVDEPDVRDRSVNLRVRAETLTTADGNQHPVNGVVLVRTFRFPAIPYGARITVAGVLETPPDDPDFSYRDYLARQGIHSMMNLPHVEILSEGGGNPLYRAIFSFKQRAQATIRRLIPDPQAALLTGILLGNDNGIPPDLSEDFRVTGMTHIIAISGFNIAILITILMALTERFLPQRSAVMVAMTGISLYTLLVGADASVVRAAIMGGIYLFARRWLGRPNFAYASLFLAAFLMTLFNPMTLWDVGFQLSFTATLGLMLYVAPFTDWTRRQFRRVLDARLTKAVLGLISEAVLVTLAAQVLTLPLMIAYFQQLSLISLPANALILPAQPGVMIWGGLATLTGMIVPALGQIFGWIAWIFLTYTTTLVRALATVPGAAVPVQVSTGGVIAIYCAIGLITWYSKQEPEQRARISGHLRHNVGRRAALGATAVTALLTVNWSAAQPDGYLHIAFLNVGQGDATLITSPSGRQILVDGGFYPSVLNDELGRQMPFWDRHLDVVVATHPDADHVSGIPGVFGRYRVEWLLTDGTGVGESPIYDAVLTAAETADTVIHPTQAGEVINIGDGVHLEVLHPAPGFTADGRNNNSVSMRLTYGDFAFLFTGDAEEQGEQAMLSDERPLSAQVFKAGHHGSRSSSTAPFLAAVRPQIIIVSAGADNRFGHPHPEVLQRAREVGATILRTDELGTIEVVTDGRQMWWQAGP